MGAGGRARAAVVYNCAQRTQNWAEVPADDPAVLDGGRGGRKIVFADNLYITAATPDE